MYAELLKDLIVLKLIKCKKRIIHIHYADVDKILPNNKLLRRITIRLLKTVPDHIVTLSKNTREQFVDLGFDRSSLSVIYNFHTINIPDAKIEDFLLHTITDEREIKILFELLEKRNERQKSTIVCSQRDPDSWKAMILNDEVSANSIMKRATKHYTIKINIR